MPFAYLLLLLLSTELTWTLVFNPNKAEGNPLRGVVGDGKSYPSSLEFRYFSLGSTMIGLNNFDWTNLENTLNRVASTNRQLIPRFWACYPGDNPISIPRDLQSSINIINNEPEYNDPDFVNAVVNFISAFGNKYNGDRRIAFVETGLLGKWGEWHGSNDISKATQDAVLTAFERAFPTTKVLTRYGSSTGGKSITQRRVGFHDDSFSRETLNWFWPPIRDNGGANVWQTQPMGGEVRPEDECLWDSPQCSWPMENFAECVSLTHTTYMKCPLLKNPTTRKNGIPQVVNMGYHFFVSSIQKTSSATSLTVRITITNRGVAPFYYPISMDVFIGTNKFPVTTELQGLLPGITRDFSVTIPATEVRDVMQLKLTSPRILPTQIIRFANEEVEYDGTLSLGALPPLRPISSISNIGCYSDSSNPRTLPTSVSYTGALTHEACYQACSDKAFTLAGVSYGQECWCGSTLKANPSSECTMSCPGNTNQPCGGYWKINVLQRVAPIRSLGCFVDSSARILKADYFSFDSSNSHERCWQTCNEKGYSVAGVQYGKECFCGTPSQVPESAVASTECGVPCSGNPNQKCGGSWRVNIVVLWNSTLNARPILSAASESSGVLEGSTDDSGSTTVKVTSTSVESDQGVPGYGVALLVLTSLVVFSTLVALVVLLLRR